MKTTKFLLTFFSVILLSTTSFGLQAQNHLKEKANEVEMKKRDNKIRSEVNLPYAYISYDILTVSFDDSGIYNLYIQNENGDTVFYSTLPANGTPYTYDLSAIIEEDSFYILIIEGPSGIYEGYF